MIVELTYSLDSAQTYEASDSSRSLSAKEPLNIGLF